eukprot:m.275299 g.275299  ORF g.275299 m.275299 type:complete len:291 (-) comp19762_c0_seq54:4480-5352(-)
MGASQGTTFRIDVLAEGSLGLVSANGPALQVGKVEQSGLLCKYGIKKGDQILTANETKLHGKSRADAERVLKGVMIESQGKQITLLVYRKSGDDIPDSAVIMDMADPEGGDTFVDPPPRGGNRLYLPDEDAADSYTAAAGNTSLGPSIGTPTPRTASKTVESTPVTSAKRKSGFLGFGKATTNQGAAPQETATFMLTVVLDGTRFGVRTIDGPVLEIGTVHAKSPAHRAGLVAGQCASDVRCRMWCWWRRCVPPWPVSAPTREHGHPWSSVASPGIDTMSSGSVPSCDRV